MPVLSLSVSFVKDILLIFIISSSFHHLQLSQILGIDSLIGSHSNSGFKVIKENASGSPTDVDIHNGKKREWNASYRCLDNGYNSQYRMVIFTH